MWTGFAKAGSAPTHLRTHMPSHEERIPRMHLVRSQGGEAPDLVFLGRQVLEYLWQSQSPSLASSETHGENRVS